jgi:hypothetical protein
MLLTFFHPINIKIFPPPKKTMIRRLEQQMRKRKGPSSKKVTLNLPKRFESVLSHPFEKWNDLENVVAKFLPEWNPTHRGFIIQNLIRFLELKVMMEEYTPNQLLSPSTLVAKAWQALILETRLYKQVTFAIQDFHGRPRRKIHHSLMRNVDKESYEERLQRTQTLFMIYCNQKMPTSLLEIDTDLSLADTSVLTEGNGFWNLRRAACTSQEKDGPVPKAIEDKHIQPWWKPKIACVCMQILKETFLFEDDEDSITVLEDCVLGDHDDMSIGTPGNSEPSEVLDIDADVCTF